MQSQIYFLFWNTCGTSALYPALPFLLSLEHGFHVCVCEKDQCKYLIWEKSA